MRAFQISSHATRLKSQFLAADELMQAGKTLTKSERMGLLRLWITEGIPCAFVEIPLLYESIREWLARQLSVHPKEVTLIGSARVGFSMSPVNYGRSFGRYSDLDFTVISPQLFELCRLDFEKWKEDYLDSIELPNNSTESKYWDENLSVVPRNIGRGFIDPYKIPNRTAYQIVQSISSTLWLLQRKLELTENAPISSKVSLRIYESWEAFLRQLHLNFTFSLEKIGRGIGVRCAPN